MAVRYPGRALMMCVLVAVAAAGAYGDVAGFERYAVILQRKPFGAVLAAPPSGSRAPEPETPQTDPENPPRGAFVETLRMCAMTETDFGLRVGIVDIKSKPEVSYFLYEGESENGVELVRADFANERALLKKDGEEYYLNMNAGAAPPARVITPISEQNVVGSTAPRRVSYAERLRRRREAEAERLKKLEEKPQISGEQLEQHLQKIQMDAIRQGMPALPIPLTREMDDQLVAEGVLPPLE